MKNQLKKSLSLLMAVLMILSCWVWVAPEKASAATTTNYTVRVRVQNKNAAEDGGQAKLIVKYKEFNGTGSEKSTEVSITSEMSKNEGNNITKDFTIPGFPTSVALSCIGTQGFTYDSVEGVLNGIFIINNSNNVATQIWGVNDSISGSSGNYYSIKGSGGWGSVSWQTSTAAYIGDGLAGSVNWVMPALQTPDPKLGNTTVTLNKVNSNTNTETSVNFGALVDQYGVAWYESPTVNLRVDEGLTLGTNASYVSAGNTGTVSIKPWFQTLFPDKANGKLYIAWEVPGSGKSGSLTLTVEFPTYTVTFDANGGKIGADDTESKDKIEVTGEKMFYGSVVGKSPAYRTRDGFEFKGFYSVDNPDALGKTATFSGTKFEDSGSDNATTITTQGDMTYYAAWQALPITATFVTADNQLIGTVEGRYNNYLTASNMYNGSAGLNAAVEAAYTGSTVKFNGNNEPIYADGATTYTFDHWKIIKAYDDSVLDGNETTTLQGDVTFQAVYKKADAAKYSVKFYDGNGNVIDDASNKSDYSFRDDVILPSTEPTKDQDDKYSYEFAGWANNIGKNFYVVDEADNDENGARIVYTHKDGAEFTVRGDASYVPVFRMIPREYSVTFNYTVDGGATESVTVDGYHWEDGITMPESIKNNYTQGGYRYYIDGWKVGSDTTKKQLADIAVNGDLVLTATYGAGVAAEYTINFYDKDGKLLNADTNIYTHNSTVTAPEVEQTIDTEDSLFTFVAFKDKNSNTYSTTATADADYYAEYTKKDYADIHYYNYDGTLIYELDGKVNSLFVGETIPAYSNIVDGENVLPTKAEDVVGTYNFTGWADGNGDAVVPGTDTFSGDTYLYAQFETEYKNYTVKFVNDDGTVVSSKTYHYGEEIEVPETEPTKAKDETYNYDFKAWDPDVSKVCYGDATYTATYRRTYNYYKVTWFNDQKAVHSEINYIYNEKIQQAVINSPVGYPDAQQGYTWALKEWIQCNEKGEPIDANGAATTEANAVRFVRGLRMGTDHLYFYPVFEAVANVLTVRFYQEDGTSYIGEAKIPYGNALADYTEAFEEDARKAADNTYHYTIDKWVNIVGEADVTTVTADVSVKPVYTAEEHNKQIYELIIAPTCTETGLANMKCEAPECDVIDYNVVLDVIPDEGNPTGQIYIGNDKWTLDDFASIDYNDVKYVGPSTNAIINAKDTGTDSEPWNKDGELSRGVGKIDYYISEEEVDPSGIQNWTNVYDYEAVKYEVLNEVLLSQGLTMQDYIALSTPGNTQKAAIDDEVNAILANYNANATGVLGNLNLVNGEEYIVYVRVSDREVAGESNKCYFSSGKIHYGSTAAEITVTGDGYGTKFCADATIKVTDDTDGFKVYLDGKEVALTDDGKYVCDVAGVHTVTVIDKNGNKTTKTFEIKGNHTFRNYTVAATCVNDGSRYDLCTVCGFKTNEVVLAALGHSYTVNYTEKAPTCVVDGYRTYTCDHNCGTKLVLNPTDNADKLAQAKKYVAGEGDAEGTWVALTADDLAHLKATGVHTYAKELDEEGNETENDAWVIDKAATCKVEGSKHKDCIKCGERVTEVIPVDKENGHKFYRDKVTKEPTCTEKGERTKTCRYCGEIAHVEDIPALGHTAGEYNVTKAATCTEKGSKILTCSVCNVNIGEPIEDEDGNVTGYDGKAVEIPALGHSWKLDGEPYKGAKLDEDGNEVTDDEGNTVEVWYQKYVCRNDSNHTKVEETEYEEKIEATVTFMNGDDDADPQVINTYVGESISAVDVAEPTKAADATYKYTFSHWATKNTDGTYTEVKFPITVAEGGATYYAVYAEKYINYTITYYKEDDGTTQYKKVGYLHNGDEVELVDGPAKAEDWQYTYKFAGWAMYVDKVDEDDNVVTDEDNNTVKILQVVDDNKVTIDGANINLFATYTEVKKQYAVTYAYSKSDILETFLVEAGTVAKNCYTDPVKKADSKYHYEFDGWNKAEQLKSVESNIYTTPNFKAVEHVFTESVKTEATCTANRVITRTCACDYSYDEEVKNTALGHDWGDPVYNETTGKNNVTCQRENCGVSQEDTRKFTATFYKEATDAQPIKTINYIPWGTKISNLPANPTKVSTAVYDYTFKGWIVKGDTTETVVDFATYEVKTDVEFVAKFDATVREYTVIFAYDAKNVIEVHQNVKAGSAVKFGGTTPVKASDANGHYTFTNWSGLEAGVNTISDIQSDVYVTAVFARAPHTYDNGVNVNEATCENGAGVKYTCTFSGCGYNYTVEMGKPLPHSYELIEEKAPTATQDGYKKYKCTVCGDTYEEVIKYVDDTINIKVTVTHNGSPKSGIQVEIQPKGGGESVFATTNANGVATLIGSKDAPGYTCWVIVDGARYEIALTVVANGNLEGSYSYTDKADCTCACHRDNLWGTIFRFFHKIIKLFTGEFKCCKNPDPMYG